MDQSRKVKTKKRWVVVSSCIVAFLTISFVGSTLWTGQVGLGWLALCQKPGTPLIWLFAWDKKTNSLHALGNDVQKCTVSFQSHDKNWQPFALSWYHMDDKGMCLKAPFIEQVYNFKQGASAIQPSYRLDIPREAPFYTGVGTDRKRFAARENYCEDDYDNPRCLVALMPVCIKAPMSARKRTAVEYSMCRQPNINSQSIVSGHGAVDDIAAIMLANEKAHGNQGFQYSLVEEANGLQGGVAIADNGGSVRCYYRQTQYSHGDIGGTMEFAGEVTVTQASREQAVMACMAVLADRNRYCAEPAILPPRIIY